MSLQPDPASAKTKSGAPDRTALDFQPTPAHLENTLPINAAAPLQRPPVELAAEVASGQAPQPAGSSADRCTSETIQYTDGGAKASDRFELQSGRVFGEYELLEELARGGMGVVFKARQKQLNRIVALKMILAGQLAGPAEVQRFYLEAEAAAQLDHPGIVPIYEVGQHDGQHFFSMGFVEGESLAQKLQAGPLAPQEAAELTLQVARAVQYAHEKGIVHRDLKPANVLLGTDSHPRVTDFGLAKRTSGASELTGTGQVLGTPSYMPPEQARGQVHEIGPASDVYSLGAMLYALVTGRPPFQAASVVETLMQVMNTEPVPPRQLNSAIPADLENICRKCLEKEPRRRYQSAQDLADDLERFLRGEPTLARPLGGFERTWRWCRRNRVTAALLATVAVTLLGGAGTATYFAILAEKHAAGARKSEDEMRTQRNLAQDAERRRTAQLREALVAKAQAFRWSGRAGRRFEGLEAIRQAAEIAPSAELRDEAIASLALVDLRVHKIVPIDPPSPSVMAAAFDGDCKRFARWHHGGEVSIHEVASGRELTRLPAAMPRGVVDWIFQFSPDGKLLAVKYTGGPCVVWDVATKAVKVRFPFLVFNAALGFREDSTQVAVAEESGRVHVYDVSTGNEVLAFASNRQPYAVEFDPAGKRIAVSSHAARAVLIHESSGGKQVKSLQHPASVRGLAWSPDGQLLAAAGADAHVYVWNVESSRTTVLTGHSHTTTVLAFNRAGNLLASTGWDGMTRLWDPYSGQQLVVTEGEIVLGTQFGPDDTLLPLRRSQTEVGLWEVAAGRELRTIGLAATGPPYTVAAACHPSGRLIASGGTTEVGIQLWDVATGRELGRLPDRRPYWIGFHPKAGTLYATTAAGLVAWPIAESPADPQTLKLGPPQRSTGHMNLQRGSLTPGGSILAFATPALANVLSLDEDGQFGRLLLAGPHEGAMSVDVSPDGRWAASGTWKGRDVKIWDLTSGKLHRTLPIPENTLVAFSPDGERLVISCGERFEFWSVGDWTKQRAIDRLRTGDVPAPACFSPDGSLLALRLELNRGFVLYDGRTLAPLAHFDAGMQLPLAFSPDGSVLVTSSDKGLLQRWDLRRVRRELRAMNLDWASPNYAAMKGPVPISGIEVQSEPE